MNKSVVLQGVATSRDMTTVWMVGYETASKDAESVPQKILREIDMTDSRKPKDVALGHLYGGIVLSTSQTMLFAGESRRRWTVP
jgi:hypothetical protein